MAAYKMKCMKYVGVLFFFAFCVVYADAAGQAAEPQKNNQSTAVSNDSNSVTANSKTSKEYLEEKQKRDWFIQAYRKKKQEDLKAKQAKKTDPNQLLPVSRSEELPNPVVSKTASPVPDANSVLMQLKSGPVDPNALKELDKLPPHVREEILKQLGLLGTNSRSSQPVQKSETPEQRTQRAREMYTQRFGPVNNTPRSQYGPRRASTPSAGSTTGNPQIIPGTPDFLSMPREFILPPPGEMEMMDPQQFKFGEVQFINSSSTPQN